VTPWAKTIVSRLSRVHDLRRENEANSALGARVQAVKQFQHARFAHDYSELLGSPRHGDAARFFLDELYGPSDFAARDAEFERVVPWMARVLPDEVMRTIADLIELHALSEELDQQMAFALSSAAIDEQSYRGAWRMVGRRADRERQLALLLATGRALDRYTHVRSLALTLRLMRAPAQASGLGRLQAFLEAGLTTFSGMHGADEFLAVVEANETRVINDFFDGK